MAELTPRAALSLTGTVRTDNGTVYVNGMDLSNILLASLPHYEDRKYAGCDDYSGIVRLTVVAYTEDEA